MTDSFAESVSIINAYLYRNAGTTMSDTTLESWGIKGGETPEELYAIAHSWITEKQSKIALYHD